MLVKENTNPSFKQVLLPVGKCYEAFKDST